MALKSLKKNSIKIKKEDLRYTPRLILKAPKVHKDLKKYNRKKKYGREEH